MCNFQIIDLVHSLYIKTNLYSFLFLLWYGQIYLNIAHKIFPIASNISCWPVFKYDFSCESIQRWMRLLIWWSGMLLYYVTSLSYSRAHSVCQHKWTTHPPAFKFIKYFFSVNQYIFSYILEQWRWSVRLFTKVHRHWKEIRFMVSRSNWKSILFKYQKDNKAGKHYSLRNMDELVPEYCKSLYCL